MNEVTSIDSIFKPSSHGLIPRDWEIKELGEFFEFINTPSFSRDNLTKEKTKNEIYYIHYGDIHATYKSELLDFESEKRIPFLKDEFCIENFNFLKEGDLIIADASEDYKGIGESIEIKNIGNKKVIGGLHTLVIRDKASKTTDGFRTYIFRNSSVHNEIKRIATGISVYGISKGNLSKLKILLPPLHEQKAIATLLSTWDKAINNVQLTIDNLQLRKKWLMQMLLTGKKRLNLDECLNHDSLDSGIKGLNAGNKIRQSFNQGNHGADRKGGGEWKEVKLEEVSRIRRGASPRPIEDPKWFSDKGRGWIRISDVTKSHMYLNETTQCLSEEGANKSVKVDKGDLIMSICATIGVPVIINIPACIHDGFVLFSDYQKSIDKFFLFYFLQYKTDGIADKGQPGTQKNLNTTIVGNIKIHLPSLEEQTAIAKILIDADKEIELLKQKLDKLKEQKKGLMQVLLTGRKRLKIKI